MKMKKAYAAALAAALMVTTAGFSVSAVDLTSTGTTVLGQGGAFETTVTASGEDVAASLDGQTLKNVTVEGYATGEQLTNVATDTSYAMNTAIANGEKIEGLQSQVTDVAKQADKAEAKADGALKVQGNGVLYNHGTDLTTGINLNTSAIEQEVKDRENADKQLSNAITNNSHRIDSLSGRVDDLGGEIDNVGAISAALAGLHPLDYDGTGSKFQLAAAMGSYDGSQAAAIGGFYHFNEDVMMSVGGATAFDGDNKSAFNVGVSFRIGQGSSGKKVNSDDVLAQLNAMNEKIAALEAENQQLSEKVAALEGGEGAEAAEAE